MDDILTVEEIADYLKVSRTTVWRWCQEGRLIAFKVGRGWRIHRRELERFTSSSLEAADTRTARPDAGS